MAISHVLLHAVNSNTYEGNEAAFVPFQVVQIKAILKLSSTFFTYIVQQTILILNPRIIDGASPLGLGLSRLAVTSVGLLLGLGHDESSAGSVENIANKSLDLITLYNSSAMYHQGTYPWTKLAVGQAHKLEYFLHAQNWAQRFHWKFWHSWSANRSISFSFSTSNFEIENQQISLRATQVYFTCNFP